MPGYIKTALHKYQHLLMRQPEHASHCFIVPQYLSQPQYVIDLDTSDPLDDQEKKQLQGLLGTLLFYTRAVNSTMIMAINAIAARQANPIINTAEDMLHFLNYCNTHPDAMIRYLASRRILHIHSDASYLSESKAR
eukprot:2365029-Ditylum_brightwellii.AAC.1